MSLLWVFKSSYTFIFFVKSVESAWPTWPTWPRRAAGPQGSFVSGGGLPGMPWYRNSFRRSHRGWPWVVNCGVTMGYPKCLDCLATVVAIYVDLWYLCWSSHNSWWCKLQQTVNVKPRGFIYLIWCWSLVVMFHHLFLYEYSEYFESLELMLTEVARWVHRRRSTARLVGLSPWLQGRPTWDTWKAGDLWWPGGPGVSILQAVVLKI